MVANLNQELWFPDPRRVRSDLVARGGNLSPGRLLLAYQTGLFPWTVQPITWWSPDPRAIFDLNHFHVPRSLARALRKMRFQITVNAAFRETIEACAQSRGRQTWISPEFVEAYTELHRRGHAHSVECWLDGALAGGVYGVATGGLFAGESMFHRVSNASKVALYFLVERLRERGFQLFDIQMLTPVTVQLGAVVIPRTEYLDRLEEAVRVRCRFDCEPSG